MQVNITSAETQTQIFMIIFIIILFITIKRRSNPVFDINVTNEIKGLGILMVIFAHIGYFLVSDHRFLFPLSVGGGIGVNLFFFLSGYGLSASAIRNKLSILDFYKKRVVKLFIPLWIILAIFLLKDFVWLGRGYPFSEIWHSFLGYFPAANLVYNIDSPLWFITPIVVYYLLFPIIFHKKYLWLVGIALIVASYLILFNDSVLTFLTSHDLFKRDVLTLYRTHFMAFPLGLIAADLITNKIIVQKMWINIANFFSSHKKILFLSSNIALFVALFISCYTAIYSGVGKGDLTEQYISLITSVAILYLFIFNKIRFGLFSIIGVYSYEIYLIHWPILSRFDIFYKFLPPFLATFCYLILFIFLAFLLNKLSNFISNKIFRIA